MTLEQLEKKRKSNREYMARVRAANPEKDREKQREWRRNNPDKWKEYHDKYYAKVKDTPEFKERRKQEIINFTKEQRAKRQKSSREYATRNRIENSEKINEKRRGYYNANPVIYRKYTRDWIKNNWDTYIECRRKRYPKDYVAKIMGVSVKEVPDEIVQAQEVYMKLKKAIYALA